MTRLAPEWDFDNTKIHIPEDVASEFRDPMEEAMQRRTEYLQSIDYVLEYKMRALGLLDPSAETIEALRAIASDLMCLEYTEHGHAPIGTPSGELKEWTVVREWVYRGEGCRVVLAQEQHKRLRSRIAAASEDML